MVDLHYITLQDSFYESETRYDYKISKKMKEIWAIQLDMLKLVKDICEKYNITWYAHAGTALGAVRDGHFIPWDDDIDIMMPRYEYFKFIDTWMAEKDNIPEEYFMQNTTTQKRCHKFTKIKRLDTMMCTTSTIIRPAEYSGIFIDIFPLDKLPNDIEERKEYLNELYKLRANKDKEDEYLQHVIKYNDDETATDYMDSGLISPTRYDNMVYKVADFESSVEFEFEGIKVPIPSGYKNFFAGKYGEDWETPQQVKSNHGQQIYDSSNSYKCYYGAKSNKITFTESDSLRLIKDINSHIYLNKPYTETSYNKSIYPEVMTYDSALKWFAELPEEYKRYIDFIYNGNDTYSYVVKNYAGEKLFTSGSIDDMRKAQTFSVSDALKTIYNTFDDSTLNLDSDSDSDSSDE